MRTTIGGWVLAGLLTALPAGCSLGSGSSPGVARAVRPSTSPLYDRNELAAQAKKALMPEQQILGTDFAEVVDGDFVTAYYCSAFPKDEGRTGHVGHERQWSAPSVFVSNVVHGYYRKTGAEAVEQTRKDAQQRCGSYAVTYLKTYTDLRASKEDNVRYELLGQVDFATPEDVEDSFGQCAKEIYPTGQQRVLCAAYLGRKNLVSAVFVSTGLDEADSRATLLKIVPVAAAFLTLA